MAAFPMATSLPGASPGLGVEPMDEFTSDLVAARVTIGQLARRAQRHLLAHGATAAEGSACACGTARCMLAEVPGGPEACRLATRLAWLPVAAAGHGDPRPGSRPEDVATAYLHALRGAESAIFYCQRVQHFMGECWFSTPEVSGEDLCARTMAVAHTLAGARRSFL